MHTAIELATELASRSGFDSLHDPNPKTELIEPYYDPIFLPTQGYGRLLSRIPHDPLSKYPPISLTTAKQWLHEDVAIAARQLSALTTVSLQPHQAAALIDFIFNCGGGNYQISTLRRCVNRGDFDEVPFQLSRWNKAGGRVLAGLTRRRNAEIRMFLEGV